MRRLFEEPDKFTLRPLRPRQAVAVEAMRQAAKEGHKRIVIQAPCGFGKCHGKGTEIIMYDGSLRKVEDLRSGDLLMGPDSQPREVLSTSTGYGPLFRVVPRKGEPFVCNDIHVLSLKRSSFSTKKDKQKVSFKRPTVVNIPLDEYLRSTRTFKSLHRLWRVPVDFPTQPEQVIPPYIMGLWLGDGTSRRVAVTTADIEIVQEFLQFGKDLGLKLRVERNTDNSVNLHLVRRNGAVQNKALVALQSSGLIRNKHIPAAYKLASKEDRLCLLAGIIDTDGAYIKCCYTVHQKSRVLADDIAFVGRSVGLCVSISEVQKRCVNNGKIGTYYAVNISGDTSMIPCRIPRKKSAKRVIDKDPLVSGFSVESIGYGTFYGFTLSGDGLYLLRDFTVTHNTVLAAHLIASALEKGTRPLFTCPAISLVDQTLKSFEFEGIWDIGVMQAKHERTDGSRRVQIASVQTLIKRPLPNIHFMILDEIHLQFNGLNTMLDEPWKDKIAIGLSATPWATGMGLRWTKLIIPATIAELIEEQWLTPTDLYIPEQVADRGNIEQEKGEFTEASASKEMRQSRIVGNVVETWKALGPGEKTFMFCVNREHAKEQMGAFVDSGIPFGYIDANTEREDRKRTFAKMKYGEIAGIASVGCLIAGVDEDVRCVIDAAPTTSEMRLVQKWGRGIRPAENKTSLIGLDHAGNNSDEGLGLFWEIHHDHLDTHKPHAPGVAYEGEKRPAKPKRCVQCHVLIPKGHASCPKCGTVLPSHGDIEHEDGELVLYGKSKKDMADLEKAVKFLESKGKKFYSDFGYDNAIEKAKQLGFVPSMGREYTMQEKQQWYSGFLWLCRERGKAEGAAAHRYREKFGVWPNQLRKEPSPPSWEVEQFDKHCRIKFAKAKEKEARKSSSQEANPFA